jgi:hypothetical protein
MPTLPRRRTVPRAVLAALPLGLVLGVAAACGSQTPAQSPPPENTAPPARTGIPLIAAHGGGIFEITRDGRDVRQLSKTPAQQPRWVVPGRRLVFLTTDAAELRSLDLGVGREQLVARVRTRLDCPSGSVAVGTPDPGVTLSLHDDDDFVVQSGRACIRLMDRNANMADFILDVRVDLATGRAEEFIPIARDTCKVARREAPPCEPAPRRGGGEIRLPERAGPPDFFAGAASPSGRWVLLHGNNQQGDYIYHQVVLYEIATRRTFPIFVRDAGDRPWPAPVPADQLAVPDALGDSVIAETPVYWLPGSDDRLVVDGYLIVPGVRIELVGDLAPPP